jgi:hypothetical protein
MTARQKQLLTEYYQQQIEAKEQQANKAIEMVGSGELDIYPYTDPQSASYKIEVASTKKVIALIQLENLAK